MPKHLGWGLVIGEELWGETGWMILMILTDFLHRFLFWFKFTFYLLSSFFRFTTLFFLKFVSQFCWIWNVSWFWVFFDISTFLHVFFYHMFFWNVSWFFYGLKTVNLGPNRVFPRWSSSKRILVGEKSCSWNTVNGIYPPWNLHSPRKSMVGRWTFFLGWPIFRGYVSFRGWISDSCKLKIINITVNGKCIFDWRGVSIWHMSQTSCNIIRENPFQHFHTFAACLIKELKSCRGDLGSSHSSQTCQTAFCKMMVHDVP